MGRFDSSAALAQRLIDLNGETATLTVFASQTQDPDRPWLSEDSAEQAVPVRAVFLNYNTIDAGRTYAEGSEIHRDDKKVLIAAKGLTLDPSLQGNITRADGTVFRIVKIRVLDPAGQKILFELQARR